MGWDGVFSKNNRLSKTEKINNEVIHNFQKIVFQQSNSNYILFPVVTSIAINNILSILGTLFK
jgi:hypothetical protein